MSSPQSNVKNRKGKIWHHCNSSKKGATDLPPVKVLLVENLQNVSTAEAKSRFFTGNQVIVRWVVVKVTLYKGLKRQIKGNVLVHLAKLKKNKTELIRPRRANDDAAVFSPRQILTLRRDNRQRKNRPLKICCYSNHSLSHLHVMPFVVLVCVCGFFAH